MNTVCITVFTSDYSDDAYGYHGNEYAFYDGAARSGGYDHSSEDSGYSKSDDSHGYGNCNCNYHVE